MPRLVHTNPSYRKHRASGQAIVTIDGRDFYLGPWRSQASIAEYDRVVGEWLAAGRHLRGSKMPDLAVVELCERFLDFARTYYVQADHRPTKHLGHFRAGIKLLVRMYADTPAVDFGPVALENVRNAMIAKGWSRVYINQQIQKIRAIFRWGVSKQLIPPETHQSLASLAGLRAGKSAAKESVPTAPVAAGAVDATLPYLSSVVRAMVETQLLCGCRPGEICSMRVTEVDRSGGVWKYIPANHKNAYRGHGRVIFLGPIAQQILQPFLMKLDPNAFVFAPKETMHELRQKRSKTRKTPLNQGNSSGSNVKPKPRKIPGECYDVSSYRRAIKYACKKAGIAPWHPHQLRHTAATEIRKRFGIEAAQHVLGHASLATTAIYAERNSEVARKIAARIG